MNNSTIKTKSLTTRVFQGELNNDGIVDFIIPRRDTDPNQVVLEIFSSTGSGFDSQEVILPKETYSTTYGFPVILIGKFTNDLLPDFIVYGNSENYGGRYRGVTPYLFEGKSNGTFQRTDYLKSTYEQLVQTSGDTSGILGNGIGVQIDSTVHAKSGSAADIENDGDLDIWIESNGGTNIAGHFLINNNGQFSVSVHTVETDATRRDTDNWAVYSGDYRINGDLYFGLNGDQFVIGQNEKRYFTGSFIDFNNDDYPDFLLGQLKNKRTDLFSALLINDGNGFFLKKTYLLSPPAFNGGYTRVFTAVSGDLNDDGLNEVILLHGRYPAQVFFPDWPEPGIGGFYIQILSIENEAFKDVTDKFMPDQSDWSSYKNNAVAESIQLFDINNDGKKDLLLNYGLGRIAQNLPKAFIAGVNDFTEYSVAEVFPALKDRPEPSFSLINANNSMDILINDTEKNQIQITYDIWNPVGSKANDKIVGTIFPEKLLGSAGNDTILAAGGDDTITGGVFDEKLSYIELKNSSFIDDGDDLYDGGNGKDTIDYSFANNSINVNLNRGVASSIVIGELSGIGSDKLKRIENIISGDYADIILGSKDANVIEGRAGNDTIDGGLGNDTLIGGSGSDVFVFSTKPTVTNIDTISDFEAGVDKIQLSVKIFAKLKGATNNTDYLVTGTSTTATQYLIYDSASGKLSYDADGNITKSKPIDIALIGKALALNAESFLII